MIDEARKQLVLDYQHLNRVDWGKRILSDLKSRFDVRIIPQGMPDCTAFEVGKREAYLYIIDKIEADPEQEMQEVAATNESMENFARGY